MNERFRAVIGRGKTLTHADGQAVVSVRELGPPRRDQRSGVIPRPISRFA